jgi:hypothetical protein
MLNAFTATHASFVTTHASFVTTHASFATTHASFATNEGMDATSLASFVVIQVVVAINLSRKGPELFVFKTNTVAAVTNHDSDVMKMIVSVTILRSM